jgi:eukaryotic-like serine/threonine-protein kinase
MDFQEGVLVASRYRLSRLVGAGGMGEVWAGFDEKEQRPVAIKRLLPAAAKHHEVVARFRREAFLLGRVESPHVAKVDDFIDDESFGLLLIMEFIEGPSLAHVLEDRSFSVEEALDLGVDVAKALVDLHEAKIVHRDLKPGNIILRPAYGDRFQAVIVDFGISRLMPGGSDQEVTGITRANIALGTVEYMAPEQILNSRDVTPVTDLYALGIILFRAVKGQHAFGHRRGEDLARAKLLEEAPALEIGRDDEIAEGLVRVVARALKKRPAQRFASAREMLAELEAVKSLADQVSDLDDTTADGASTLVGRVSLPDAKPASPVAQPRPAAGAPAAVAPATGSARASLPSAGAPEASADSKPAPAGSQATAASRPSMPSISEAIARAPLPSISEVPASVGRAAAAVRSRDPGDSGERGIGRGTVALAVLTAFVVGTAFGLVIAPSATLRPSASAVANPTAEPAPGVAPSASTQASAELAVVPTPSVEPSADDFEIVEVVTAPPASKPPLSGKMPDGAWVPPRPTATTTATVAPKPSGTSVATAAAPKPSGTSTGTGASTASAVPSTTSTSASSPSGTGAAPSPPSDVTATKPSPSPAPSPAQTEPAPAPTTAPRPVDTSP